MLASRAVAEPVILRIAERREPRPPLGYVMVMTAATLWTVNGAVSKVILTTGLSSLRLAEVRSTGPFVLLALALAVTRPEALRLRRRELPYFILFGIGGLALVQWFCDGGSGWRSHWRWPASRSSSRSGAASAWTRPGRRLARSGRLVRPLHPNGRAPDQRARPDLARLPRLPLCLAPLGSATAVVELPPATSSAKTSRSTATSRRCTCRCGR